MVQVQLGTIITIIGFIVSILTSAFIAGSRWTAIRKDVEQVRLQVAEVKGMFVLRLRDDARKE